MDKDKIKKGGVKSNSPLSDGHKKTKLVPITKKDKYRLGKFVDEDDDEDLPGLFESDDDYEEEDEIGNEVEK
jgi:hypothetical protein